VGPASPRRFPRHTVVVPPVRVCCRCHIKSLVQRCLWAQAALARRRAVGPASGHAGGKRPQGSTKNMKVEFFLFAHPCDPSPGPRAPPLGPWERSAERRDSESRDCHSSMTATETVPALQRQSRTDRDPVADMLPLALSPAPPPPDTGPPSAPVGPSNIATFILPSPDSAWNGAKAHAIRW
jgi:hypothetical protein